MRSRWMRYAGVLAGLVVCLGVACTGSPGAISVSDSGEQVLSEAPPAIPDKAMPSDSTGGFSSALAVALVPPHFPDFGASDLETMFAATEQIGVGVSILSWDDPNLHGSAQGLTTWAALRGVPLVLALSPTALEPRDRIVLPPDLAGEVGENVSFNNPIVHDRFIDDALRLAQLRPSYLCLGTEVNLWKDGSPEEFAAFVQTYAEAYRRIHESVGGAVVFPSFYWDGLYNLDDGGSATDAALVEVIGAFGSDLDVLAISTYPANRWSSPQEIPAGLYAPLASYINSQRPLVVLEIGWPSRGTGTEAEQVAFIERMPALFEGLSPRLVTWSLLHDIPTSFMNINLASTGLRTIDGLAKPAWDTYLALDTAQ